MQYLSSLFWRRWTREYLQSLQQRQKWYKLQRNLAVNDIVLLMNKFLARSVWPLRRVLEVYHNKRDTLVHSAKVKSRECRQGLEEYHYNGQYLNLYYGRYMKCLINEQQCFLGSKITSRKQVILDPIKKTCWEFIKRLQRHSWESVCQWS